jgi:hypothetical protein
METTMIRRGSIRGPSWITLAALVATGACAGQEAMPELDKEDVRTGKADKTDDSCETLGLPPDCDVCEAQGWYGDGECDSDICPLPDEADCVPPTAFRLSEAQLADPHIFVSLGFCIDVTSQLNSQVGGTLNKDGNGDGLLDLSILNVFRPLNPAAPATDIEVGMADCSVPPDTSCAMNPSTAVVAPAEQKTEGTCLGPIPGTAPAGSGVAVATAPCYASEATDLSFSLSGIDLDLQGARVGGTFADSAVTGITNGLAAGFVSEAQANNIRLPADLPLVGGKPLSSVLPGGAGSCQKSDGRDIGPDGTTRGWYVYLNFSASEVGFTE